MSQQPGRTESVPVDHACLSSVATFYMERVFAETGTTYEDIAEAMAEAYMRTPEHARRVKLAPPCSPVGKEYARELGRIVTRLKKYHYHDGILPADLLIPLAEAFPKPYRDDCLRAYARMMGFLGAQPERHRDQAACARRGGGVSLRCAPGDLALIIQAAPGWNCVGELVEVLYASSLPVADWVFQCVGWNFSDGDTLGHAGDFQLLPLRGDPDAVTETRDEVSA